jgi:hypothetical protein
MLIAIGRLNIRPSSDISIFLRTVSESTLGDAVYINARENILRVPGTCNCVMMMGVYQIRSCRSLWEERETC